MNNTFASAINAQETRTENDMRAFQSTLNKNVDFFYKAGAMRGQDPVPAFIAAYNEDPEMALRNLLWLRDVRGGAGERESFRKILKWVEKNHPEHVYMLLNAVPEVGRWDDLFSVETYENRIQVAEMLQTAILEDKNGLAAKWTPRKGEWSVFLRNAWGMSPKQYRKTIVSASQTVEQSMCARKFDEINYSHVPSVAHSRYRKAFGRHSPERYAEYLESVENGESKINASAVFPHDVVRNILEMDGWNYSVNEELTATEIQSIVAQWDALPDYIGDASMFPMIDVSGSMTVSISGSLSALQVAVALGLYCADKNKGDFKDCFLTFSEKPQIQYVQGNIVDKVRQTVRAEWGMDTNLHAAFQKMLDVAVLGKVSQEDMPKTLVILSDMQFNSCVEYDDTAMEMIRRKYEKAGYQMPNVVFWNLNSYGNVPARFDENGVALISGYSPIIMKSVLAMDVDNLSPENIMKRALMVDRYSELLKG